MKIINSRTISSTILGIYLILISRLMFYYPSMLRGYLKVFLVQLTIFFVIVALLVFFKIYFQFKGLILLVVIGHVTSFLCNFLPFVLNNPKSFLYGLFSSNGLMEIISLNLISLALGGGIILPCLYVFIKRNGFS